MMSQQIKRKIKFRHGAKVMNTVPRTSLPVLCNEHAGFGTRVEGCIPKNHVFSQTTMIFQLSHSGEWR